MKKSELRQLIREWINEKKFVPETYFSTYSGAVQAARKYAEDKGFEIDEDDWHRQITVGSGKPGRGRTIRHSIGLIITAAGKPSRMSASAVGKPSKKNLQIIVYNRETENKPYELTCYIN